MCRLTMTNDPKRMGTLPPEAAFVLQLQADADVAAGSVTGRVEHVASGRAARFSSLPELLIFIAQALEAPPGRAAEGDET